MLSGSIAGKRMQSIAGRRFQVVNASCKVDIFKPPPCAPQEISRQPLGAAGSIELFGMLVLERFDHRRIVTHRVTKVKAMLFELLLEPGTKKEGTVFTVPSSGTALLMLLRP
jgi:hypothetical protein